MTKNKRLILCILCVGLCLIIYCVSYIAKLNVFVLSPLVAKAFTGNDLETFCSTDGADTTFYRMFTYAKVKKNGDLILVMTDQQIEDWKNGNFYLQLLQKIVGSERQIVTEVIPPTDPFSELFYKDADIMCGFEISEDYTRIYADPEDGTFLYFGFVPHACLAMQVLSGKPSDEISYTFIEYDEEGNIVEQFVWPDDFLDQTDDESTKND